MNNVVLNYGVLNYGKGQKGDIYVIEGTPYIHATIRENVSRLISLTDGNRWSHSNIHDKPVHEILTMIGQSGWRVDYLGECEIEVTKQ